MIVSATLSSTIFSYGSVAVYWTTHIPRIFKMIYQHSKANFCARSMWTGWNLCAAQIIHFLCKWDLKKWSSQWGAALQAWGLNTSFFFPRQWGFLLQNVVLNHIQSIFSQIFLIVYAKYCSVVSSLEHLPTFLGSFFSKCKERLARVFFSWCLMSQVFVHSLIFCAFLRICFSNWHWSITLCIIFVG